MNICKRKGKVKLKGKMICVIGAILLFVVLFITNTTSKPKEFMKDLKKVKSYQVEASMEIRRGEELRTYDLNIYCLKDDVDYYKVSMFDKELNQEQIILRNKDGVFVITPSLNQIYQFEGDWPKNSPKPYMLETIYDVLQQKDNEIQEKKQMYLVKAKVHYPNDKNYRYQTMYFDEKSNLKSLDISDEQNQSQVKIVFHRIQYDNKLSKDLFAASKDGAKSVNSTYIDEADLPLYPMYTKDSQLKNVYELNTQNEVKHIMEYADYTIVQTKLKVEEETKTVLMPYELYDGLQHIGYYDGQSMSMVYGGVEFTIYSNDLHPDEMMEILSSMRVVVLK